MELQLTSPVIVARSGQIVLLAESDVATNKNTNAQTWQPDMGYSEAEPLQGLLQFLYYLEEVNPPAPWTEPNV